MSILRAGETMELALCEVYKDAQIGKILIQTNEQSGEPEVILNEIVFIFSFFKILISFYSNQVTLFTFAAKYTE